MGNIKPNALFGVQKYITPEQKIMRHKSIFMSIIYYFYH